MRTKFTQVGLCLLCLNGLSITAFFGQSEVNCTASLSYTMEKMVTYAISEETDVESVSNYDLLSARGFDNTLEVFQCLDEEGHLSTTTDYTSPANNPDSWQPQIYQSVLDRHGARFYDQEGELLYQSSNSMREAIDAEPLMLEDPSLFGLRPPISSFEWSEFDLSVFDVILHDDESYTLFEEDSEVTFDPYEQSIVTRYFEEGLLVYTQKEYFKENDEGFIIPTYEVIQTYSELMNGGWMQKTETRIYSNYTVNGVLQLNENTGLRSQTIDEDVASLQQFDAQVIEESESLSVYPNPTIDILRIDHAEGMYEIKLMNAMGHRLDLWQANGQRSIKVDLNHVPSGSYFIIVCTDDGQIFKQIIKK